MYQNIPEFIWNRIFDVLQVVLAGGLVAWFASHYLKKKDEITRVKGILLEKRLTAYEAVIKLLGGLYRHTYVDDKDAGHVEQTLDRLMLGQGDKSLEYAEIFADKAAFDSYLKDIDKTIKSARIYLDRKVLEYLKLFQAYFEDINSILRGVGKLKLKEKYRFSEEKLAAKEIKLLRMLGVALDTDISFFYGKTEEVITKRIRDLNLEEDNKKLGRCMERFIVNPWDNLLENLSIKLNHSKHLSGGKFAGFIYAHTFHKDFRNRILFKRRAHITNLFTSIMLAEYLNGRLIVELEEKEVHELLQKVMARPEGDSI